MKLILARGRHWKGWVEEPRAALLFAMVPLLAVVPTAHAHPLIEEAGDRYAGADFAGALTALEEAEELSGLEREEVIRLLELRALVHAAMDDAEQADRSLAALASIEPGYGTARRPFPPEMTPELRARLMAIQRALDGELEVIVQPSRDTDHVTLEARVRGDPAEVVRGVRVYGRAAGDPEWRQAIERLRIAAPSDVAVQYWAAASGPGGATLVSLASEEAPVTLPADESATGGPWEAVLWVTAGAVVVAAAVVGAVLLSSPDGNVITRPERPVLP